MARSLPFAEVLDAIDQLPAEDQETLIEIVRLRLAERGRQGLVADIQEAKQEFAQGNCRSTSVDELMDEILS